MERKENVSGDLINFVFLFFGVTNINYGNTFIRTFPVTALHLTHQKASFVPLVFVKKQIPDRQEFLVTK